MVMVTRSMDAKRRSVLMTVAAVVVVGLIAAGVVYATRR